MSIEKSRKQDVEANVRKRMTLITCTLQVKKNPQRRKINNKKMLSPLIEKNPIEKAKVRARC